MLTLSTIFCTLLVYSSAQILLSELKSNHRITNGEDVDITKVPWQAGMNIYGQIFPIFCGGVIISENYILTAAHCVDKSTPTRIGIGSSLRSELDWVEVDSYGWHELWDRGQFPSGYDIAYIKLKQPLVFNDKVQKIDLTDEEPPVNDPLYVSGWGKIERQIELPDQLQGVDMYVINRLPGFNETILFATNDRENTHPWLGDAGDPLTWNGKLVGLCSFIMANHRDSNESGFSNIATLRPWIKEKTGV